MLSNISVLGDTSLVTIQAVSLCLVPNLNLNNCSKFDDIYIYSIYST